MVTIFVEYSINKLWKRFACLQNKLFRHFIPFLLNNSLK